MLDFIFLEKVQIFISECLLAVMFFLVQDVIVNICNLRMAVGKRSITYLPAEFAWDPGMVVDEVGGVVFYILDQVR
jgi:hypothetical protein